MATIEATVGRRPNTPIRWDSLSLHLWTAVFLFAGTDILTTWIGITYLGAVEMSPVVESVMAAHGLLVMIPLKLAVIAIAVVFTRLTHEGYKWAIPLILALTWAAVTAWNLSLFALVL